jgi:AGCS family alanine or glycine:cation symporter
MGLGSVIDFSDAMIFAMAVFNIIGLYLLMPKVKALMQDYHTRLAAGEFKKVK